MLEAFYPDEYLDSVYTIDFQKIYDEGYRGLLFDIDNTLVPHGAPATREAVSFFENLRRIGLHSCFVSNNQRPRVAPFAVAVGEQFVENAHKPSVSGYQRGMKLLGTGEKDTLFIGDQLFTDIFGAKRAGLRTILVKPIHPKEEIQIVLKRRLEWIVLFFYKRKVRMG